MHARIRVLSGDAKPNDLSLDPEQIYSIGRSRENSIVLLQDEHASRLHAKIYFESNRWMLHDYGLNGTRVHKERINHEAVELEHGYEIRIGEVRFKFTIPELEEGGSTFTSVAPPSKNVSPSSITHSTIHLQIDELTALCQFRATEMEAKEPYELVKRALELVWHQTGGCLVGYLSLDPNDPLPKLVLPDSAQVDVQLSRHLTRRVEIEKRTVWLSGDSAMTRPESESLSTFQDAICVPLRAGGTDLGALHVYQINRHFEDRHVRFCEVLAGYLSHGLHQLKRQRTIEAENRRLKGHATSTDELLGDSQTMMSLRAAIRKMAAQPFTVLIQGESGSGKELVASALHKECPQRANGPLVVVNCGAIPASVVEAELFGYKRGAFTGATHDHPGYFQQADEGTLFLDEIGELPLEFQPKLLRAIEQKSIRPMGAVSEIKVDVRIVAATNRNLEQEVKAQRFRSDLFFRLNRLPIRVPPLREHAEDIPMLVQAFLDRLSEECHRTLTISDEAIKELKAYHWPGNVRQLRGLLESLVVMSEGERIDIDAVKRCLTRDVLPPDGPPSLNLDELERWATERVLKQTSGNVSQAAQILGISRDTLYTKMKKWGLSREMNV